MAWDLAVRRRRGEGLPALTPAAFRIAYVSGLLVTGCPSEDVPIRVDETTGSDVTSSTDSIRPTSSGEPSSTGTTEPEAASTGTTGDDSGGNAFIEPSDAGDVYECSFWEEDCPPGEKCMPWANDGGSTWNALKCSPIAPDPDGVGEPCTVEDNGVSGVDSCVQHSMCFYVDTETNTGVCVGFCEGSPENPGCSDPSTWCTINGDGVLAPRTRELSASVGAASSSGTVRPERCACPRLRRPGAPVRMGAARPFVPPMQPIPAACRGRCACRGTSRDRRPRATRPSGSAVASASVARARSVGPWRGW